MLKRLLARLAGEPRAQALIDAGNQAEGAGRLAEACELYRRAVAVAPRFARAYLNLGAALEASGDRAGAERAYAAVLEFDPRNPYASYNLGNLAAARGDAAAAERLLRQALAQKRDFPEACVALANALEQAGRRDEALEELRAALAQRPRYAGAWFNCALLLRGMERLDEAEDALRRAIDADPGHLAAHLELESLLRGTGRVEEALQRHESAPAQARAWLPFESAGLLTALHSDSIADAQLFARHRAFAERLEALHAPYRKVHAPSSEARRLRVGYVSADFRVHPAAAFILPVLARHDRSAFEVHCYMTDARADPLTKQMAALAERWHDAAALGDAELADAIHGERIDILVDLMGHAGATRLGAFARRPAPVQVSWLGYLHSLGLDSIRYRLTDSRSDPAGVAEPLHTETLVRLPATQWCYRPLLSLPAASSPPCASNGFVTFGSFNHPAKLSPSVRRLWRDIIARVPDARLVVAGVSSARAADALRRELAGPGLDAGRIRVVPRVALHAYFALFAEVDIALDTWPYSGGTTTCDALWMGVPVLTVTGSRSVSRSSASLLGALGLDDWIAADFARYVALAQQKARDPALLAALRGTLRRRMQASPLMDEAGFTRGLEDAYRRMWADWCQNRASC